MPKMNITPYLTITNNYEQRTMNFQKQSQTKPILSAYVADKIAPLFRMPFILRGPVLRSFSKEVSKYSRLQMLYFFANPIFYHCASMYGPMAHLVIKNQHQNQPRDLWKRRELIVRIAMPIMNRTSI
jgi:hypothetical protein